MNLKGIFTDKKLDVEALFTKYTAREAFHTYVTHAQCFIETNYETFLTLHIKVFLLV